jgi:hypothetical protein
MSSLSNILEDFRKSLHNDLDMAFNRGSQNLLTHLVEKLVSDNRRQTEVFIKAINDLKQEISSGGSVKIPEVYHTDVKLVDIINTCNIKQVVDDNMKLDDLEAEEEVEAAEEAAEEETEAEAEVDDEMDVEEDQVEGEVEEIETVNEEDAGEAVDEATIQEEDVGEAEDAEEEALQEIEVDGTTYYYDSEGNVFTLTAEGVPCDEPVGKYDMESGEFGLFSTEEEEESESLEEFDHKGKTYYKDSEGNVYNASGEPLPYISTNGRFVRKA